MATLGKKVLKNGKWQYPLRYQHPTKVRKDGRRAQVTLWFPKQHLAEAEKRKIENELHMGAHTVKSQTATLGEALDGYMKELELKHRLGSMAGSSLAYYRSSAKNHVIPKFGHRKLTDITSLEIEDLLNDMAGRGYKRLHETVAMLIRQSLKFAVKRKWLTRSPLTDQPITLPPIKRAPITMPTREEIKRLLFEATQDKQDGDYDRFYIPRLRACVVILAVCAGMRRGEITGLQWENVDFVNGLIYIRHSYSWEDGLKGPKTKAGNRTVPMSPPVRWALEWWAAAWNKPRTGYVLTTASGRPIYSMIRKYLYVAQERAGLLREDGVPKFSLHALRHAAVSLMIEQKMEPLEIAKIVGHSNVTVTLGVYAHLFEDAHKGREVLDQIGHDLTGHLKLLPSPVRPGHDQND